MKIIPLRFVFSLQNKQCPLLLFFVMIGGFLFLTNPVKAAVPQNLHVVGAEGGYAATTTALGASWTQISHTPSIDYYEVSVSSSGQCDNNDCEDKIVSWQSVSMASEATISSLDLTIGQTYYFCVRAVSAVDSVIDCSDGTLIDFTPPITNISATTNGNQYIFGNPTRDNVVISLSSDDVDIANIFYCYDESCLLISDFSYYSGDIEISDPGETVFKFFSQDQAGNTEEISSRVVNIDLVSPYVVSVAATNTRSIYVTNDNLLIAVKFNESVSVSGDDLESVRINLNTQPTKGYAIYQSGSGSDTLIFSRDVVDTDSTDHLDYFATDSLEINDNFITDLAGNDADVALPDPSVPGNQSIGNGQNIAVNQPIFISPSEGYFASSTVDIQLEARDFDGVSTVDIYDNSDALLGRASQTSADNYHFLLDTTLLTDGDNYIKILETSLIDNVHYSNLKHIIVDNTLPTLETLDFKIASSATTTISAVDNTYYIGSFEEIPDLESLSVIVNDNNLATDTVDIMRAGIKIGSFAYDENLNNGTWQSVGIDSSDLIFGENTLIANFHDKLNNFSQAIFKINVVYRFLNAGFVISPEDSPTSTPSALLAEKTTLSLDAGDGTSSVVMATGTEITRTDGANFDLSDISIASTSLKHVYGFAAGLSPKVIVQWGIPNIGLSFDPAITINFFVGQEFNGQTLEVRRSTNGLSNWTDDGIVSPKNCLVVSGICTFSATKASYFSALTKVPSGGYSSNTTQRECQTIKYSDWQRGCFSGKQYRYIIESFPDDCRPTKDQKALNSRKCSKDEKDNQANNPDNKVIRLPKIKGIKIYGEGSLLRGIDKKIYIIEDGVARRIFSLNELHKLSLRKIFNVHDEVLVEYHVDNIILRGPTGKIYLILNGKKIYIADLSVLQKYVGRKIYDASDDVLQSYSN